MKLGPIVVVLFSLLTFAQELPLVPNAPKLPDKAFFALTTSQFSAMAFDAETTRCFLRKPNWYESNPLLGERPSGPRIYGVFVAQNVGAAALGHLLKGRSGVLGKIWWVPQAYMIGIHLHGGTRNLARGAC